MLIEALGLQHARVISLCGAGGKTTLMFTLAREFVAAGDRVLLTTTTKIARDEADGWRSLAAASAGELLEGARALLPEETGRGRSGALIAYSRVGGDGYRLVGLAPELLDEVAQARRFDRILVEADGSARKPLKAPAAHEPVIPASTEALVIVAGINGLGLPLNEDNLFRAEIWSRLSGLAPGEPISAESLACCTVHPDGLARGCPPQARRVLFLNQTDTQARRAQAQRVAQCLAAAPAPGLDRVVIGRLLPAPYVAEAVPLLR